MRSILLFYLFGEFLTSFIITICNLDAEKKFNLPIEKKNKKILVLYIFNFFEVVKDGRFSNIREDSLANEGYQSTSDK